MQRDAMFKAGAKLSGGSDTYIHWPYSNGNWNRAIAEQQKVYAGMLDVNPDSVLIVPPVYLDEEGYFGSDKAAADWVNMRYAEASALHLVEQ